MDKTVTVRVGLTVYFRCPSFCCYD